ncbi:acyl-protein synthetase [Aliiglaciecola sp. LCG003]|uniref:LuxE/PaaK family acyltransferase n=1 Tax=Aliiglaciecola sp. LCG003 TaxID=3053655 RepID=UPI00257285DA|nr:acyl-protein synthetase [Aliiglaciecola sp. LCG003]WJG10578.1 acyl-protein synthetase [Aliiglaciecola sp. LCG003]
MLHYTQLLTELFAQPVYQLPQAKKEALLLPIFAQLHQHHQQHCQPYRHITSSASDDWRTLNEIPYLAVRLFKLLALKSIDDSDVFKTLQSSGTTSQTPARIFLDRVTSSNQSKALVNILQHSIGKQRLPMLIIDSPAILKDRNKFSARSAGIQGLAFFGRDHTYALNDDMQPDWDVIEQFVDKYPDQPVLLFGFTFMVWQHFIQMATQQNKYLKIPKGILLHSGGWKKLEAQKVDNLTFKARIKAHTAISQVVNFYGMAEQVGSIFVECKQGHLHAPLLADIIIREPYTLEECTNKQVGLIQVLSVLPFSYPGYSILTEDMGQILGVDDCCCGRKGKYFEVHGRLPKTEIRGCSDTQGDM